MDIHDVERPDRIIQISDLAVYEPDFGNTTNPLAKKVKMMTDRTAQLSGPEDDLFLFQNGDFSEVVLSDPIAIRDVFHKDMLKGSFYEALGDNASLGETSVFASEGEIWRKIRLIENPSFSAKGIEKIRGVFLGSIDELIAEVKTQEGPQVVDAKELIGKYTINSLTRALFSRDLSPVEKPLLDAAIIGMKSLLGYKIAFLPSKSVKWSPLYPPVRAIREGFNFVFEGTIDKRREEMEQGTAPNDLLTSLMDLSNKEIKDQLMTFYTAGTETSATVLKWFLYEICPREDLQEELFGEMYEQGLTEQQFVASETYPDYNSFLLANSDKLVKLKATVQESLRMHPAVEAMGREVPENEEGGVYIQTRRGKLFAPSGTIITVNIKELQRNPEYWENPEEFDIQHFLDYPEGSEPKQAKKRKETPYSFMAFGAGSRMCLGKVFAEQEMLLAAAKLIQNFQFKKTEEYDDIKEVSFGTPDVSHLRLNFVPR